LNHHALSALSAFASARGPWRLQEIHGATCSLGALPHSLQQEANSLGSIKGGRRVYIASDITLGGSLLAQYWTTAGPCHGGNCPERER
jgi:hypothetical protein